MNLLVVLIAASAQLALANDSPGSVQIGRPLRDVTIGASTQTWHSPLDSTVTLKLVDGTFASLLDEVGKQTKTEYVLIQGIGQCRVSAFVRGMTAREFLQLSLEVGGLTYQSAGRSNRYIIARRNGGPDCERVQKSPDGSCSALEGKNISAQCKNGSLSSLVNLLYSQTGASFLVWNEAVNQPITIKLRNLTLAKTLKTITKQDPIDIEKVGNTDSFLIVRRNRKRASSEMEKSTESAHVGLIYQAPPRFEPPPNAAFKQEIPK